MRKKKTSTIIFVVITTVAFFACAVLWRVYFRDDSFWLALCGVGGMIITTLVWELFVKNNKKE